jgi:hypothetical protein
MDYYKYQKYKNKYLKNQIGGNSEILNLDNIILNNSIWSDLTKIYNSKTAKEIEFNFIKTDVKNILIFLNGYRRILVDYYINRGIKFDVPAIKDKYKNYTIDYNFENLIKSSAFGADSPTSDYDVTLEGPGIHIILYNIINDFKKNIGKTTAITFDTNIYIAPVLRLNTKTNLNFLLNHIPDLKFFELTEKTNDVFSAVPVPTKKEIFKIEWDNITTKFNEKHIELTDSFITEKYEKLFDFAELIDKLVYQMNSDIFDNKNSIQKEILFFELILNACKNSIESAFALSTIIVVVYGIQGKKDISILNKENYLISIYENLAELKNHWNYNQTKDDSVKLKVTKYIYRILFALNKINLCQEYTKYLTDIQYLNDNKSSKDIYSTKQFDILKSIFLIENNNLFIKNDIFDNILNKIKSEIKL